MNRIALLGIACSLFSFCGPTEAEIQSRIDSAVEEALVETTLPTTTLPPTTTAQTTTTTSSTTTISTTTTTTTTIPSNYQVSEEVCSIPDYNFQIREPQKKSSDNSGLGPTTTVDQATVPFIDNSRLPQASFKGFVELGGTINSLKICTRNTSDIFIYSDNFKSSVCFMKIENLPVSSEFQLIEVEFTDDMFPTTKTRDRCMPENGKFEASRVSLRNNLTTVNRKSIDIKNDTNVQILYNASTINDCCASFLFKNFKYGGQISAAPPEVNFTSCSNFSMNRSEHRLEIDYDIIAGDFAVDSFSVQWQNFNGSNSKSKGTYSYAEAERNGIILPNPGGKTSITSSITIRNKDLRRTLKFTVGVTDTKNVSKTYSCELIINASKPGTTTTTTTTTTLPPTTTTLLNQVCVEFVERAKDVDENIENILIMEAALVDDVIEGIYTYGQAATIQIDHVELILQNYEDWVYEITYDSRNMTYYFEYGYYLSDLFDAAVNLADYFIDGYSFYLDYWVAYRELAIGHQNNLPPLASCNY